MGAPGWDADMAAVPHAEWNPKHDLERVDVSVVFTFSGRIDAEVIGRSSGKRTALWTFQERPALGGHAVQDLEVLHDHLVLVQICRPTTQAQLETTLRYGSLIEPQDELPLY